MAIISWDLLDALGQMRALFGSHVAMIASRNDLDIAHALRDMRTLVNVTQSLPGLWTDSR